MAYLQPDKIKIYPSTSRAGAAEGDGTNIVTEANITEHLRNIFNINNGSFVVTPDINNASTLTFYLGGYLVEVDKASVLDLGSDVYAHCTINTSSPISPSFNFMEGIDDITNNTSSFVYFDNNPEGGTYTLHLLNDSDIPADSYQRFDIPALPRDRDITSMNYNGSSGKLIVNHSDGTNTSTTISNANSDTIGMMNNGAQIFKGVKTFSNSPKLSTNSFTTNAGNTVSIPESSNDTMVLLNISQDLTNKTYNGYTLNNACAKDVTDQVSSTSTDLVTSQGVYNSSITGGFFNNTSGDIILNRADEDITITLDAANGDIFGILTNTAQTFKGVKTFNDSPKLSTNSFTTNAGNTVNIPESSNDTIVLLDAVQELTNKKYNGYTLGSACAKGVSTAVSSSSANLITSQGVYNYSAKDISFSGNTLNLNNGNGDVMCSITIPDANSSVTGFVNTGAQTFNGVKTFNNSPKLGTNSFTTNGGNTVSIPDTSDTIALLNATQALTNKTYNGYTLNNACAKDVTSSVSSGGTKLITSGGVYNAINPLNTNISKTYITSSVSGITTGYKNIQVVSSIPSGASSDTVYLVI